MSQRTYNKYRRFSIREQRAYSAGRGYGACRSGRYIKCKTHGEKRSFIKGLHSARRSRRG